MLYGGYPSDVALATRSSARSISSKPSRKGDDRDGTRDIAKPSQALRSLGPAWGGVLDEKDMALPHRPVKSKLCRCRGPWLKGAAPMPDAEGKVLRAINRTRLSRQSFAGGCHPRQRRTSNLWINRRVWWSQAESSRRPLECHSSALPTELWPHPNR